MGRVFPVSYGAAVALAFAALGCGQLVRLGDIALTADGSTSPTGAAKNGADGGPCAFGQVSASQVLWVGDSWVQIPGTQHTRVRDLARAAGAIGPNDDYVDLAASGATMAAIASQYSVQESSTTKVKVIIMDGGGIDLIVNNLSDASVVDVVSTFEEQLATIANDGTVQQIVYFLVPELPAVPGVSTALRPGMQMACAQSVVPCHFLDLQPLWVGHPEYTSADGIQASDAGAEVLGNAIWALMQENCIAQ